jgi:pyruvate dehydrogenase E1 component
MEAERHNQLNPHKEKHSTHIDKCFGSHDIHVIATTDYMRAYAEQIRPYIYSSYSVLGTDGFGRSDSREELREFFEINTNHIVRLTAFTLYQESSISKKQLDAIYKDTNVDPAKPNPWEV